MRILYAGDEMRKAYIIRILIAALILSLSFLAFEAAYFFTIKLYEDDIPYWENEDEQYVIPEAVEDDVVETGTTPLFLLLEKEGYVIVEYFQGGKLYDETDIKVRDLPNHLQREIVNGIPIKNFEELYDFLENYSS